MLAKMRPLQQRQLLSSRGRSVAFHTTPRLPLKHRPLQLQCNASAAAAGAGSPWPTSAAAAIAAAVQQQPVFQLAASVVRACQHFVTIGRDRLSQVLPHPPNVDKQVSRGVGGVSIGSATTCTNLVAVWNST